MVGSHHHQSYIYSNENQTKTTNHPYHSSGSSNGYIVDGVETPYLYLTEGIYKFDYSGIHLIQ